MKAIWSDEAELTYDNIVNQIERRFSFNEAQAFVEETFDVIDAIESFPKIYPISIVRGMKNICKAVIHPHSTLFYEIRKNYISLLIFWDNRDNPDKIA